MAEILLDGALEERLNEAVATANYRLTLSVQRQNAKLKLQKDLIYAFNGGMFRADSELLTFVKMLLDSGKEDAVLLDINQNPIEISDLQTFFAELMDRHYEALNSYLVEYKSLQKSRTTRALIGE